jgi:PAS domain S-box-containing protein
MAESIDYGAIFQSLPMPVLLLTPNFTVLDCNAAYSRISGRTADELRGVNILAAFPDNPDDPGASGTTNLDESLRRCLATGEADIMALQRYDVEAPASKGDFAERYWCPVNVPVKDAEGRVVLVLHAVEEVSDLIRKFVEAQAAGA